VVTPHTRPPPQSKDPDAAVQPKRVKAFSRRST
jgi:hypothetical protein